MKKFQAIQYLCDPPYYLRMCNVDLYKIQKGSTEYFRDDLYLQKFPRYIGIAMSRNGSKDFSMSKVSVYKNGERCEELPSSEYLKAYWGLTQCVDESVSFKQFKKGMLMFGFKRPFPGCERLNTCIQIKISFQKPLEQDVKLVIYRQIDHLM